MQRLRCELSKDHLGLLETYQLLQHFSFFKLSLSPVQVLFPLQNIERLNLPEVVASRSTKPAQARSPWGLPEFGTAVGGFTVPFDADVSCLQTSFM